MTLRRTGLRAGSRMRLAAELWTVTHLSATPGVAPRLTLRSDTGEFLTGLLPVLLSEQDWEVLPAERPADPLVDRDAALDAATRCVRWDVATREHRDAAVARYEIVHWAETGMRPDGSGGYDVDPGMPDGMPAGARFEHVARQLPDVPHLPDASARSIRLWRDRVERGGLPDLLDRRIGTGAEDPLDGFPPAVAIAMDALACEEAQDSQRPLAYWYERLRVDVQDRVGDDRADAAMPTRATFDRRWGRLLDRLPDGERKYRRGAATFRAGDSPRRVPHGPNDVWEIDGTPGDLMVTDPVNGKPFRVTIVTAVDVYSGSIVACRIFPGACGAQEALLTLYDGLRPFPEPDVGFLPLLPHPLSVGQVQPGATGNDDDLLGRVFGSPQTLIIDQGREFDNPDLLAVAQAIGMSVQRAPRRTGEGKPHVEVLQKVVLNKGVLAFLPGATGGNVKDRGDVRVVEGPDLLLLEEAQRAIDIGVAAYQRAPREGLRRPGLSDRDYSPNELFWLGTAAVGRFPVVPRPHLALEFLRTQWVAIRREGIEIDGVRYDAPVLHGHIGDRSRHASRGGKWRVKLDPRRLDRLWIWLPDAPGDDLGRWHLIPSTWTSSVPMPFTDRLLRYAKQEVAGSNGSPRQQRDEVMAALRGCLVRLTRGTPRDQREASLHRSEAHRVDETVAEDTLAAAAGGSAEGGPEGGATGHALPPRPAAVRVGWEPPDDPDADDDLGFVDSDFDGDSDLVDWAGPTTQQQTLTEVLGAETSDHDEETT